MLKVARSSWYKHSMGLTGSHSLSPIPQTSPTPFVPALRFQVSTSEVQDYSFSQRTSLLASEGGAEAAPPARPTFQQEPSMLHAAR